MAKQSSPTHYEEQSLNVDGFWDPEDGPIHCIPMGYKLLDNPDKTGTSTLVLVKLVDNCVIRVKIPGEEDKVAQELKAGSMVGVWGKPGLRPIMNNYERKVFIQRNPAKDVDTGEKNKMMGFDVKVEPGKGVKRLPMLDDSRSERENLSPLPF